MTRMPTVAALALAVTGLLLAAPRPAAALCWTSNAVSKGVFEAHVAARATHKLTYRIKRAGRRGGYTPLIDTRQTDCRPTGNKVVRVECMSWARVCR